MGNAVIELNQREISAYIDIHRQHGKQCHESNQGKQLLSEATHKRLLRVIRLFSSFLFFFRFDILVDGYNCLDRNISSSVSTIPSP